MVQVIKEEPKETVVVTDGNRGPSGLAVVAIIILLLLVVWFLFGGRLFNSGGSGGNDTTDVNVETQTPPSAP